MAIQNLYAAGFDADAVTMLVTFDDVSLILQQVIYHNATNKPGSLIATGPLNHTWVCAANTDSTVDLTPQNITLTKTVTTGKFGQDISYSLPGGEQITFQWPS